MKMNYEVQENTHRNYWLYKWLKNKCKAHLYGGFFKICVEGFPIYPLYQCPRCRYWWNNMMRPVEEKELEFVEVK